MSRGAVRRAWGTDLRRLAEFGFYMVRMPGKRASAKTTVCCRAGDLERMRVLIVTTGDRTRRTGGYLYIRAMEEGLRKLGDSVTSISIPDPPTSFLFLAFAYLLLRLGLIRPDMLVVDVGMAGRVAAPVALIPRLLRMPIVALLLQPPLATLHGHHLHLLLENLLLRRVERVITVGTWVAEELVRAGARANRTRIVRPGSDLPTDSPQTAHDWGREGTHFLCVANWAPQKGIVDLVMAFDDERLRKCSLDLVGDQTLEPAYSAWVWTIIPRRRLQDRIKTPGAIQWEGVSRHYFAADIFVLPSFTEGMPVVCGEALRAGLPVIAYDIPALREIVSDGVNGLLVRPGDLNALTAAMVSLADDPGRRRAFSNEARRAGLSLPTWQESALRFRQALLEVSAGL